MGISMTCCAGRSQRLYIAGRDPSYLLLVIERSQSGVELQELRLRQGRQIEEACAHAFLSTSDDITPTACGHLHQEVYNGTLT